MEAEMCLRGDMNLFTADLIWDRFTVILIFYSYKPLVYKE